MKTWLIRLSVILNLLCAVAVGLLYFNVGALLRDFLAPMHERKVSFFETFPPPAGATVFLGDSITEGGQWREMFPTVEVRNRGIGGDTTTGVLERLQQVSSAAPQRVFLMIGTNDLTHGPGSRETSYQQYRQIVERLQQASPHSEIYLQSLLPRAAKNALKLRLTTRLFRRSPMQPAPPLSICIQHFWPRMAQSVMTTATTSYT